MLFKWVHKVSADWIPTRGNVYETEEGTITIPDEEDADIEEAKASGLFCWEEADRLGGSSGAVISP